MPVDFTAMRGREPEETGPQPVPSGAIGESDIPWGSIVFECEKALRQHEG